MKMKHYKVVTNTLVNLVLTVKIATALFKFKSSSTHSKYTFTITFILKYTEKGKK